MKISIIIPTFNSSETIQDTINSVIFQNFKNYEIIIVDNNSKDKTIEIIKKNRLIDIKFVNGSFLKGWHPPHSSFFVQKELFNKYGFYKTTIGNSADVELMYRFLEINNIYSTYVNYIFVKMRYGGKSNKKFNAILKQNIEIIRFLGINNNYYKIFFFFIHKLINRLKQFLVRP